MRRNGFFTTCLLLVSFFMYKPVYSQIEIYNNGNVKMGATGGAAPTEQLELWGDFYVGPDNASNGFWVTKRYNSTDPVLKPQWTNRMWIGSFQDYMRNVVTWELYTHNGGVHTLSDSSIKENVKNLDSAVEKIKKLKPVRYDFKKTFYSNLDSARKVEVLAERKNNVGFVAQDLMKVFPKLVSHEKEVKLYSVNQIGLIPVLVKAIKEQQAEIEKLRKEVDQLKKSCCK